MSPAFAFSLDPSVIRARRRRMPRISNPEDHSSPPYVTVSRPRPIIPSMKEAAIEVEGRISSVLAGTMFRVELNNQHQVLATVCGKIRKRWVRLTVGDRVKMEMSPYDLNKARITWRIG